MTALQATREPTKGRVIVLHDDLDVLGGAESVCMHSLEAIQSDFDVTLVTESEPDLRAANEYFGTDVTDVATETVNHADLLERFPNVPGLSTAASILNVPFKHRLLKHRLPDADLVISTRSREVSLPQRAIHYVHYPWMWQILQRDRKPLRLLVSWLSGYDPSQFRRARIVTNSRWTAEKIEATLSAPAEVVAPPIRTDEFSGDVAPSDRENGFVALGRVVSTKNVARSIRILDDVRDRGHDIHLHVIGPQPDLEYTRTVRSLSSNREWVSLEGKLPRDELVRAMETHRYGIHGHETEHFGISVAEMVAAGVLPFVPSGGGQQEIVDGADGLLYEDRADAVEKIDRVLSNPSLEDALRSELPDVEREYGADRFEDRMRRIVCEELGQPERTVRVPDDAQ